MSTISASTTSTTAFKITTDTTGALVFQTGASPTTAMTLGSDQSVTFAGTPTYSGGTANGVAYLNGSKVLTTGTALVFDGSNLGVGVTPSSWGSGKAVEIGGTGLRGSLFQSDSGVTMLSSNYRNNSGDFYVANGYATRYYQYAGQHIWNIAGSGTAGNAISFTQAMTLDASGRLTVNGTSPNSTTALTLQESASLSSAIAFKNRNSTQTWAVAVDTLAVDDKALGFLDVTNNVMRMTLDASGKLLVGLTSSTGFVSNLIVSRYNVTSSPIITWTNNTSNSGHCHVFASGSGITSDGYLAFGTNELGAGTFTERARISTAGVFTTPYQPVVAAYRSSNLTGYDQTAQTLVTVFNATEVNIGSCYSTSTGLFTAPATGTYLYYASAYTGGPSTLSQVWAVQNGTRGRSSRVGSANDVVVGTGTVYLGSGGTLGIHFYGSDTNSTIVTSDYHTFLYIYFLG